MEIPPYLLNQVNAGNVVLLLGAGASLGAKNSQGDSIPSTQKLARKIADKFLGGSHGDDALQIVSELAISESDLMTVQEFIRDLYCDFHPAKFHQLLATFRWYGLATTNFDLIIERAYEACDKRRQELVTMFKNGDRVDERASSPRNLMFLKLHGCISRTQDPDIPLILTVEQYITHREGRDRVFSHLKDWGYEHPIVFVGHSLQDPDIRQMLLELGRSEARSRFYTVTPNVSGVEKRHWESKRITTLEGTFEEFLHTLDTEITSVFRGIVPISPQPDLAIADRFVVHDPGISSTCQAFLTQDVEYVQASMPTETVQPQVFYRGYSGGWSAIDQNLDIRRNLQDTILSDVVISNETDNSPSLQFCVIKGHAGSGKSVLLKRIAREAAITFGKLCLFLQPHGRLSTLALDELHHLTGERVFLFIDKVGERASEIVDLINDIRRAKTPLTIICSERSNEWKIGCEILDPYVSEEYEVGYLSSREIDDLLSLLEHHKSLGTLSRATLEEKRVAFANRAGRQLLVALHEATLGKSFEDIIADEYARIKPELAQRMYLGICVLNRFAVPVRAGIIARVFGIRFTDFQKRFFDPLEKVVFASHDRISRDYVYTARHPHVAEMVFDRILSNPHDRLEMYIELIKALNIDYKVDETVFKKMTRGRSLIELFPDHQMVESIYRSCRSIANDDPFLFQQMGIYEMTRADGNLEVSGDYLRRAEKLAPYSKVITHSMCELELKKAENSKSEIKFNAHLVEATRLARILSGKQAVNSYGFHSLAKIGIAKLERILDAPDSDLNEKEFNIAMKDTEKAIQEGLQRWPADPHLLTAESQVGELLMDSERVLSALRKAFNGNPHLSFIAIRLAKYLRRATLTDDALAVYRRALLAGATQKILHYNYARLLIDTGEANREMIEYELRQSFTKWDRNYDAQFWYARQLFLNGKIGESLEMYRTLKDYHIDASLKRKIRGPIKSNGGDASFTGRVGKLEATYAFITRDGIGDSIFLHVTNAGEDFVWEQLYRSMRVKFFIGFTYLGPAAFDLQPETSGN